MGRLTEEDLRLNIIVNGDKAQKELIELENNTQKLNQTNKELRLEKSKLIAAGKKNSEAYKNLTAEIKQNNTAIAQNKARMEVLRNQVGITGLSFNQLNKRARDLRMQINSMTPSNPSRAKLKAELKQIDAQMLKVGMRAKKTRVSLSGMANGFNQYFGMIAAFAASFTGVILGFRQLIDMSNDYGASVADLSSITGLVGEDLDWLSDKAKELTKNGTEAGIKITASAQAIVDSYKLMGSAKPELLKNKEALSAVTEQALIMADAAGIKAPEAVDNLANTMNQFNAPASEAGRYINVLAAGSKEGAAAIPLISKSMTKFGAAAAESNISVEQSVGLIETLAEKGLKGEEAGTQLKNVILKLATSTDKNLNPKIVGINKALENLSNQNLTAAEMTKFFGLESYVAAQVLVNNHEKVQNYTEAVTGTSVALEQAAINTETNKAALERAKNSFQLIAIDLGEKLAPALTFSTNGFSYLMKAVVAGIDVWKNYKSIIIPTVAILTAYAIAENASVVADKLKTIWTNRVTKAISGLNKVIRNNPWAIAIIAAGALVAVLKALNMQTKNSAVNSSIYTSQLAKEKREMNKLFESAKKYKEGTLERKKAIEKLKKAYPEYLSSLKTESANTIEIEAAQKLANTALEKKYALMAMSDNKAAAFAQANEERMEAYNNLLIRINENAESPELAAKLKDDLDNILANTEEVGLSLESASKRAKVHGKTLAAALEIDPTVITSNLIAIVESNNQLDKSIDQIERYYARYTKTLQEGDDEIIITSKELTKEQIRLINEYNKYFKENLDYTKALTETQLKKLHDYKVQLNKKKLDDDAKLNNKLLAAFKKLQSDIAGVSMDSNEKQLAAANKKSDDMELAAKGDAKKLALITRMREMDIWNITQQWNKRDSEAHQKSMDEKKASIEAGQKEIDRLLMSEMDVRLAISKQEYKELIDFAKEHYEVNVPALEKKAQEAAEEIRKSFETDEVQRDVFGMSEEDWDNLTARMDAVVDHLQMLQSVWGAYNDYKATKEQAELTLFERNQNRRKQVLQKRLDQGIISEEKYNEENQKLDAETDKKKRKIAYDQAKRERNMALFSIALSTAKAIIGFMANPSGYPGVALSIGAGIVGAIQAAAVMARPLPELATGNVREVLGLSGKKYNATSGSGSGLFTKATVHNGNKIVGEKEPELVFSGPDTRKMLNTPELMAAINYTIGLPEYASGNYSAPSTTSDSTSLVTEIQRLNDHLDQGIIAKLLADEQYFRTHNEAETRYTNLLNDTKM